MDEQMYDLEHVLSLTRSILSNDKDQQLNAVLVANIVDKSHCGDGYFSWDGILDDLSDILGYDRAAEILANS